MIATPSLTSASAKTEIKTSIAPRYQVHHKEDVYQVSVDLPGVKKEHVNLQFEAGILSISATRTPRSEATWKPVHRELGQQDYALKLRLHDKLDVSAISAKLEDGVLTLTLPVKEAVKPRIVPVN